MAASKPSAYDVTAEVVAASKVIAPALKRLTKALASFDPTQLPIGTLSDTLYDLRQLASQLKQITAPFGDVVDPAIKLLEDHFIQTLAAGEASGVQGKKSRVQITESLVPTVEDWPKFYAHIKKTGNFELLNRAPNKAAITERWDAKKQVPGIKPFHIKKVSCTKLGGKA